MYLIQLLLEFLFTFVSEGYEDGRFLNRGIRLEVVAKLLGHSTTRVIQHYAKLLQNNILSEVKMLSR